jgi:hypothetical protein
MIPARTSDRSSAAVVAEGAPRHTSRARTVAVVTVVIGLVALDRALWVTVSQWREDQATNLWLGLHFLDHPVPFGLISSVGVPNPNGMPLLGALLSRLPNLFAVSLALSGAQALAAAWLCRQAAPGSRWAWVLLAPLLAAVDLRSSSIEFWNNWVLTTVNLLFLAIVLRERRRPRIWHAAAATALALLAPAFYLAGVVNTFSFALLWWFGRRLRAERPPPSAQITTRQALAVLAVAAVLAAVVWIPYLRAWDSANASRLPQPSVLWRVANAATAVPGLVLVVMDWTRGGLAGLMFANQDIVPAAARRLKQVAGCVLLAQAVVAAWAAARYARARWRGSVGPPPAELLIPAVFLASAYTLSPLLGGPAWHRGQRPEMTVQFVPAMLLLVFGIPYWLRTAERGSTTLRNATVVAALSFSTVSAVAGGWIVYAHRTYRGTVLSIADVPLHDKERVVEWIARDWMAHGREGPVPVAYALAKGPWSWLPDLNLTVGRGFDYELLVRFGLPNAFEDAREKAPAAARYTVSYGFLPVPDEVPADAVHVQVGRLRISVAERPPES